MNRRILTALLVPLLTAAADWPQFRGPNSAGVADDAPAPVKWSADEGLAWKAPLPGQGLSCPVVVGDRVYVTAASGPQQARLHVLAFDVATGKPLWDRQLAATGSLMAHPKTTMAAPTPAADATGVYALFSPGDLAAFDRDGSLRWYRSLTGDYQHIHNNLGLASSLILHDGVLIVPMDNTGASFLAGIDVKDGRNLYKIERPKGINWVTPVMIPASAGRPAELLMQASSGLASYDPKTGTPNWKYALAGASTIPSPVVDQRRILAYAGEVVAIDPVPGQTEPTVAWKANKLKSSYGTPLLYRGRVYMVNSAGVLNCADAADGKVLWDLRLKGPFTASIVASDGKLYLTNDKGVVTVVEVGDKPSILATNEMGEDMSATPAIAGGRLFFRSDKHLFCVAPVVK